MPLDYSNKKYSRILIFYSHGMKQIIPLYHWILNVFENMSLEHKTFNSGVLRLNKIFFFAGGGC